MSIKKERQMTLKEVWNNEKARLGCDILLEELGEYYLALFEDRDVIFADFEFAWHITEPVYTAAIHKDRISEVLDYYRSKGIKVAIMKEQ